MLEALSAEEDGFAEERVSAELEGLTACDELALCVALVVCSTELCALVLVAAGACVTGSGSSECTTVGVLTDGSDLMGEGSIEVKSVDVSLDLVLLLVGALLLSVVVVTPPVR